VSGGMMQQGKLWPFTSCGPQIGGEALVSSETAFFSGTARRLISRQEDCGDAMTMLMSCSHMVMVY
jgi:hypothetical protein